MYFMVLDGSRVKQDRALSSCVRFSVVRIPSIVLGQVRAGCLDAPFAASSCLSGWAWPDLIWHPIR